MSQPRFDLPVMIRTTPRAKLALDRVVALVRASDRARWKGKRATQEAVFSAVWLWLEDMEDEAVVDAMARYLPRLEAVMRGEVSPASSVGAGPKVTLHEDMPGATARKRKSGGG